MHNFGYISTTYFKLSYRGLYLHRKESAAKRRGVEMKRKERKATGYLLVKQNKRDELINTMGH